MTFEKINTLALIAATCYSFSLAGLFIWGHMIMRKIRKTAGIALRDAAELQARVFLLVIFGVICAQSAKFVVLAAIQP